MLAIVGASGKLGFATLTALLDSDMLKPEEIVCTTSSDSGSQKLEAARKRGVQVRRAHWDDQKSFESAFQGCDKLFLISSSRIQKDFGEAPEGKGREADHYGALEAAEVAGVKHVYYTSLAFAKPSKSRVMKAHERTEDWFKAQSDLKYTVLREGLYNESWPLYLGHFNFPGDDGTEIPVAGDSKISWTAIPDLGFATAKILSAPSDEWAGKTCYLSQSQSHTLKEVAEMVSKARGKETKVKVVDRTEHEKYYVEQRGIDEAYVKWWSKSFDALRDNECEIKDSTFEDIFAKSGSKPKTMEATITEMFSKA
ncbi:hypothetical protein LTR37_003539 [Vermiconidia calcicola]|uniref:Uncharacterized protein n=1 Tax=Vermiconidia calcicola TaxID=1690605 RepID=A0ACC3NRH2_9PEZI|nr:hypothetical protein LTR37_003539 [Vermiconidia calcicola]